MIIVAVFMILALGAFLALSEMAISMANPTKLGDNKGGAAAKRLKDSPERFLGTIQLGITLLGLANGAVGGDAVGDVLKPYLGESVGGIAGFLALTYISIVFGELTPKSVALANPVGWAEKTAPTIEVLMKLTRPFVWALSTSANAIKRALGIKPQEETITDAEAFGFMHRAFAPAQASLAQNMAEVSALSIGQVMTHIGKVVALRTDMEKAKIETIVLNNRFSKYPVEDGEGNFQGWVSAANALLGNWQLNTFVYLSETATVAEALQVMKAQRKFVGLVIDERGTTVGISTLHDLIEDVVGADNDQYIEGDIVRGDCPLHILNDMLNFEIDEDLAYTAAGAFIEFHMGAYPSLGSTVRIQHTTWEVVEMDGNRISKIRITPILSE